MNDWQTLVETEGVALTTEERARLTGIAAPSVHGTKQIAQSRAALGWEGCILTRKIKRRTKKNGEGEQEQKLCKI